MNVIGTLNSNILKYTQSILKQNIRHRYALDPGSLEQRLLKAVTEPVLPKSLKRINIKGNNAPKRQKGVLGNYGEYLVEKCRNEVIENVKGKMLLVYQINNCKKYHLFRLESTLFDHGLQFFYYPSKIMKLAATGSNLLRPIQNLYINQLFHLTIVGDCSPQLCRAALTATKNEHKLLLLGGILQYRIMNIDQIEQYAAIESMEQLHGELLHNLSCNQNEIATNLYSHQNNLSHILNELENRGK